MLVVKGDSKEYIDVQIPGVVQELSTIEEPIGNGSQRDSRNEFVGELGYCLDRAEPESQRCDLAELIVY